MAADGFAPLKSEWIGPLRIDLPFQEIERGIACKPRRGLVKPSDMGDDYDQEWAYLYPGHPGKALNALCQLRSSPARPGPTSPVQPGPPPGFDWLRPIKSKLEGNRSLQKKIISYLHRCSGFFIPNLPTTIY